MAKISMHFAFATLSTGVAIIAALVIWVLVASPRKLSAPVLTSQERYDPNQLAGVSADSVAQQPGFLPELQQGIGNAQPQEWLQVQISDRVAGGELPELRASPGEIVRLTLVNNSPVETEALHDIVIAAKDRVNAVGQAAVAAGKESDWIPHTKDVLAATALVTPGNSDTIVFRAPAQAGLYRYFCTFPGHAAGEIGTFLVQ
jgi:plastocyanin